MANDFLENQILALQHQMRALDSSLEMILQSNRSLQHSSDNANPRDPECPKCGGDLSCVTTMGCHQEQYVCKRKGCDFLGTV